MAHEFKLRRRVEFAETDMAGIVHFSNFFRFMEATEHAFFRSLGLELHTEKEGRMQGWARVHATCDYREPARYEDLLEIALAVREKGSKALRYEFVVRKVDEATDRAQSSVVARGELKVVCIARAPGQERIHASAMPDDVARIIEVAPSNPG